MGKALPIELLWKARQMYDERWTEEDAKANPALRVPVGERKWSQMAIAKHLGISETSVLRAIHNMGRLANRLNMPLPETKTDEQLNREAGESAKRLLAMIETERNELTPGKTKADQLLDEVLKPVDIMKLAEQLKEKQGE